MDKQQLFLQMLMRDWKQIDSGWIEDQELHILVHETTGLVDLISPVPDFDNPKCPIFANIVAYMLVKFGRPNVH